MFVREHEWKFLNYKYHEVYNFYELSILHKYKIIKKQNPQ